MGQTTDSTETMHTDVHDLNRELAEERDTLRAIMEATNAHIAYLDKDFNFILINSTYARGSGHSEEELMGRNHFEVFPNEENEAIFKQVRDSGEPVEFKAKPFEYADQPWRGVTYWDWTLIPLKYETGDVRGVVLSLVDVTEVIQAKQFSDALNTISHDINSVLDFNAIMERVVVEATKAVGCESAAVLVKESGAWVVRYTYGSSQASLGNRYEDRELPILMRAVEARGPVAVNDTFAQTTVSDVVKKYSARSLLAVPLIVKEEVIGAVVFHYVSEAVPFTPLQIDFADKLAGSLSLALENASLYSELEEELEERRVTEEALAKANEIANTQVNQLQQALLPSTPSVVEGYEVASVYIPAREGELIGGDFYDVFRTERGKVGLLIGDVSGKGIPAAALAASARSTIRAFAYDLSAPGAAMTKANAVITNRQEHFSQFVTVFLAVLDPETGVIKYASAGHPPPIIVKPDGSSKRLKVGSPPLAVDAEFVYEEGEASLNPGDTIAVYTDGVSEARSDERMYGIDGIERTLLENVSTPADDLLQAILAAAARETGTPSDGDIRASRSRGGQWFLGGGRHRMPKRPYLYEHGLAGKTAPQVPPQSCLGRGPLPRESGVRPRDLH